MIQFYLNFDSFPELGLDNPLGVCSVKKMLFINFLVKCPAQQNNYDK